MKKTLALLVLALACILPALAQTNPFALVVFPTQLEPVTVAKMPGGAAILQQAITIAAPMNVYGNRPFVVSSPMNYGTYLPIKFASSRTTPATTILNASTSQGLLTQVFIQVDTDPLSLGFYTVPIFVWDSSTGTMAAVQVNISVVDGHTYVIPDAGTKIVPHLAVGAGWRTILQLTNPNSSITAVDIHFFAPDGTPTAVRRSDGYSTDVYNEVVNGFGTKSVILEDAVAKNTQVGSAQVRTSYGAPLNVTILYQTTDVAAHDAALPALPATASTLTLFYDNTGGHVTGLALTNSLNYAEPVQICYYDEGGTLLVKAAPVTLNANGQTAFVVSESALANRKGVIRVTMPFPALSGFVLRFNKDMQFIPILP